MLQTSSPFRCLYMSSKDISTELNAFMGRMRDGETREMVENLQAAIEYQAEKLHIYDI